MPAFFSRRTVAALLPMLLLSCSDPTADLTASDETVALPADPAADAIPPEPRGTAFFIGDDGYALTNAHTMQQCEIAGGVLRDGSQIRLSIRAINQFNDLALLQTTATAKPGAKLRILLPPPGERVVVFGFPFADDPEGNGRASEGTVFPYLTSTDMENKILSSAPVATGHSGSPLLDGSGNVLGVVNSMMNLVPEGEPPRYGSRAINGAEVAMLLDSYGVRYKTSIFPNDKSVEEIVDRARDFTFRLTCVKKQIEEKTPSPP
ncbi:MAG: serine protease [Azoarcus sp.]|nr:serine protease [Azoarcus sp.]